MKDARKRVLIFQEAWNCGGIETFVMGLIRSLDPNEFSVEIVSAYSLYEGYDEEIAKLGHSRVAVFQDCMPGHLTRLVKGLACWKRRLSGGNVDIVHVNAMDGTTLAYTLVAKHLGVPVRVDHSHNTSFSGGMRTLKQLVHQAARLAFGGAATRRLACSHEAGKYLFNNRDFQFVPNGIDVERFRFDPAVRSHVREELGIGESTLLFGSVGRLSYQKNPLFCVEVLAELVRRDVDVKLLLVGDGELVENVKARAAELGILDRYIYLPAVSNPEDYYCALDEFLMPSRFEGTPFALLEAQCSGLPCVVSDAIQDEVCVTDLVRRIDLTESISIWCEELLRRYAARIDRVAFAEKVQEAGFSTTSVLAVVEDAWT